MPVLIQIKEDVPALIEKKAMYRFWDKERQRSNRAKRIQEGEWRPGCSTRHSTVAWSGPPHDLIESITCLDCGAWASKPEMKDRGYDFDNCPDWIYNKIMDEKLVKRNRGVLNFFKRK